LAIGGSNQNVAVVDITTRSVVNNHTTQSTVHSLSWELGGSGRLAIALEDTTVSIWNTTNDTVISGTGHTGPVTSVAWGNHLASASADKTIIVWNV
jgi:WD40 repeat protein